MVKNMGICPWNDLDLYAKTKVSKEHLSWNSTTLFTGKFFDFRDSRMEVLKWNTGTEIFLRRALNVKFRKCYVSKWIYDDIYACYPSSDVAYSGCYPTQRHRRRWLK